MQAPSTSCYPNGHDAQGVALLAIGWILGETRRAERFLALTGLDPAELRAGLESAPVQVAAIDFLMDHEPDLIACAQECDLTTLSLITARGELAR